MSKYISNHGDRAVALLPSAYRTPPFEAFIRALVEPVQVVEDFCEAVYGAFDVETATAPALGQFGALVDEAQGTLSDDEYRRIIRAKARALRSADAVFDIVEVAALLNPDGTNSVRELPPCYYEVTLVVPAGAPFSAEMRQRARRVLDKAKPAGWGREYMYAEGSGFFTFDGPPEPGFDEGGFIDIL